MLKFLFIFLASILKVSAVTCNWGTYNDPSNPNNCLQCNAACGDCSGPTAYQCGQCNGLYSSIQGICMKQCPLGYLNSGNICVPYSSSTSVVYDIDFTLIGKEVVDKVSINGNMGIESGSTATYYPYFDANDPYPVYKRGFYFNGSAYFQSTDYELTFGPVFTLGIWMKPLSGTSYIFSKQNSAGIIVGISIKDYYPNLEILLNSLVKFQSTTPLSPSAWNFLMIKVTLSNYQTIVSITVGTTKSVSSILGTYFTDSGSNFNAITGCRISNSQYTNFYIGYIWQFTLYNSETDLSSFIQTSGCVGCSICPLNNNNECLSNCLLNQYINGTECLECSATCQVYGCFRYDPKCNLCYDKACLYCNNFLEGCVSCYENAYYDQPTSTCLCNYNYVWDDLLEMCRPCSDKCSVCDGGGYLGCKTCKPGYYMIWGLCYITCPTGYSGANGVCTLIGSTRVLELTLNLIQPIVYDSYAGVPVITGYNVSFYPFYEASDPLATIGRGYYFTGTSLMHFAPYMTYTVPFLEFAPVCYIAFWINPTSPNGIVFSDVSPTNNYSTIIEVSLVSSTPQITLALSTSDDLASQTYPTYKCQQKLQLNTWSYLLFDITLDVHERTFVTCYINGLPDPSYLMGQGHFTDITANNSMILGTAQTGPNSISSNGFQGFLYKVIVDVNYTTPNSDFSTNCTGGCSVCGLDGVCLSTCSLNQYPGSGYSSCSACDSNCNSVGCRNNDSTCNLCLDPNCRVCPDYSTTACTQYKCSPGYYAGIGVNCIACDPSCGNCNGGGKKSCKSCNSGFYLLNGACHPFCPTGYTTNASVCLLSLPLIVNLNLGYIEGIITDSQSNFKVLSGSTSSFYPYFDPNDPWPIESRGYYFHNNSYLQFPPNSVDNTLLTLGNEFTFSVWLNTVSDGILFSKVDQQGKVFISIKISNFVSVSLNLGSLVTQTSSLALSNNWNYVGISVQYQSDGTSTVVFYVNGASSYATAGSGYYNDTLSGFYITLGALSTPKGYSSYWTGSLYMFKVYSQALNPPDYTSKCDNSVYSCSLCPSSTSKCIETCSHDTWWTGTSCQQCNACSYESCVRQDTACNLCFDIRCLVCTSFTNGTCTQCIPNASLGPSGCVCNTNYLWDAKLAACSYCDPSVSQIFNNACLKCYYNLKPKDITAYYSQDYTSVVFDLAMTVQTASSDCNFLFYGSTLQSFGNNPQCSWGKGNKQLVVVLGTGAYLGVNSTITFNVNTLVTNITVCVELTTTTVPLVTKFTVPSVPTSAVISALRQYYRGCGDLYINGAKSTGSYGRQLNFKWEVDPSPNITAPSDLILTSSYINILNSTLFPTTLTVRLTVTNWLGFSSTTYQLIEVYNGIGVELIYDQNLKLEFTSSESKSIYVSAAGNCLALQSPVFTWSVLDMAGPDSRVNSNLLWSSQTIPSKLFIPPGSLAPGKYTFLVEVHDAVLAVKAETTISLVVDYSELEINFKPPYASANVNKDFVLDGSVAYDPDNLGYPTSYNWTCYNTTDCTHLLSDPLSQQATVSKNTMSANSVYYYTLSISKGNRTASRTLTIQTNSNSTLPVVFPAIPKYINNQENFVIKTMIDERCNCTYYWSILSGSQFNITTDIHGKDLGVQPYSMVQGEMYVVQLEVFDAGGEVSVYRETFTTDIYPVGGALYASSYTGVELLTLFTLYAPGWYDPKGDNLPLTYGFGYYINGERYFLNMRNESSTYTCTLPSGNPLKVFVRVYDTYQSFTEASMNIIVQRTNVTPSDVIESFYNLVEQSWVDPDVLPGSLNNLLVYVTQNSLNSTYALQAFNVSLYAIKKERDSIQAIDFSKIDVLLQMVNSTAKYNITKASKSGIYQVLNSITQTISENSVIMSSARCSSYAQVLNNVSPFTYATVTNDPTSLYQANEILKALALASSRTMGQGQYITYTTPYINSHFKLYIGTNVWDFKNPPEFNASYILLPKNPLLQFNSSVTALTILSAYNTLDSLYNISLEHSSAIEFSIVKIYNNTEIYLDLNLGNDFINITVPVWNPEIPRPRCAYWALTAWSNQGCSLQNYTNGTSLCRCSHTSLYSSGSHLGEVDDDDDNWPFIFLIICLLALLWLLIACCLALKDKKESESKIFVEKILAGLPPVGKKGFRPIANSVADQLGKNLRDDRSSIKKDSNYVPVDKIGVIGAYFDEKPPPESSGSEVSLNKKIEIKDDKNQDYMPNKPLNPDDNPGNYRILPIDDLRSSKPSNLKPIDPIGFSKPNFKDNYDNPYQSTEKVYGIKEVEPEQMPDSKRPSNPGIYNSGLEVLDFDQNPGPKDPNRPGNYIPGPRLSKIESLEPDQNPDVQNLKRPGNYAPGPRLSKIEGLESGFFPESKNPNRPGNYVPGPRLSKIEGLESDQNPDFQNPSRPGNYIPGPRLAKIDGLESESFPESKNPNRPGNYIPGPRLSKLEALELDQNPEFKSPNKPGNYNFGPRLPEIEVLESEDISQLNDPKKSENYNIDLKLIEIKDIQSESYANQIKLEKISESSNFTKQNISGANSYKQKLPPKNLEIELNEEEYEPEPNQEKVSVVDSYFQHRSFSEKKKHEDNLEIQDLSGKYRNLDHLMELDEKGGVNNLSPRSNNPLEEEKLSENTQLFTQIESPRQYPYRRKKHEDQELPNIDDNQTIVSSSWIVDYYFSAILFYHEEYSRFSRFSQGVCSFFLQTVLIGGIVSSMGSTYATDKGSTIDSQASNIGFQDVAVSFTMVIVANFIVSLLLCCLFRHKKVYQHLPDHQKALIQKNNKTRKTIGIVIVLLIILGTIALVALTEFTMKSTQSILWIICLFIAFIIDFFLIQLLKVVLYSYGMFRFLLPSN